MTNYFVIRSGGWVERDIFSLYYVIQIYFTQGWLSLQANNIHAHSEYTKIQFQLPSCKLQDSKDEYEWKRHLSMYQSIFYSSMIIC